MYYQTLPHTIMNVSIKIFKLLSLFALAFVFSQCGTTEPSMNSGIGNSVLQVTQILDTVQGKFYELAQSHLTSTPQEVLVMTADWAKSQPNVASATWFDSLYIDITMKSGLRTLFAISRIGNDSLCLTRGGGGGGRRLEPSVKANHTIVNKSVLIYSPFVGMYSQPRLYDFGEHSMLVNKLRHSGKGVSIKVLENDECNVAATESFGNYGVVILDTHGVPDGFLTGQMITGLSSRFDTDDVAIKEKLDYVIVDGYNKIKQGYFRFCNFRNIANVSDWQKYLSDFYELDYRLMATPTFIKSLPASSNTILVGNMCYSGWNNVGKTHIQFQGTYDVKEPIKQAFVGKFPLGYYSYGTADGLSEAVDNDFAKKMEDTLLSSLIIDGDSTGNAYLNSSNGEFTAAQLGDKVSPTLPFTHTGPADYSFDDCVNVLTDSRDGNIYKAVCIGNQVWMAENLRFNAPGSSNNSYGRFYDATATSNICPNGWHVPTVTEWTQLFDLFGGLDAAGGALKSKGTWDAPNTGATNSSGFTALPGGFYHAQAGYRGEYSEAYFSTSTLDATSRPQAITLHRSTKSVKIVTANPTDQVSCRCLKD